ncbi:MAG: diphosphate--fructose-6-phosphate 1-phosphotransferase [Vulcanimicrobiota bacterium]
MKAESKRYGILVGGGPAPGINSVISSVTIEATKRGHTVIGIYDGFKHLMDGNTKIEFLTIPKVTRIHRRGGSILHTSRANPTKNDVHLRNTVETLKDIGITHLVTIGGDDTLFSATTVAEYSRKYLNHELSFCHVPKTIDNDLPLPAGVPTFGFETARSEGARMVSTYFTDARATGRWFVVVAMGRKTGHLALGIGKSASATLTLIPEEFPNRISLPLIVDTIAGSVIKRMAMGRPHGVAIVAEGFLEFLNEEELKRLLTAHQFIEHDEHGHLRLSELNFSDILKFALRKRLSEFGIDLRVIDQEIGYELRCVPPCAFDIDYTRNLGFGAVDFLENGGSNAMITIQGDKFVPMTFQELQDAETGKTRIRAVDTDSLSFRIAREYMIRLNRSDLDNAETLRRLASSAHVSPEQFKQEFEHILTDYEPVEPVPIEAV